MIKSEQYGKLERSIPEYGKCNHKSNIMKDDFDTAFLVVDRYAVKHEISKGSFGRIYLAKDLHNECDVVVKMINKNKKARQKIINDSEIPNLIVHPNIVKVENFVEDKIFAYIIYPYNEQSRSIASLKKDALDFKNKKKLTYMIKMLCQICDAVKFMHDRFVVHRDIKLANILISENTALLIDFDLACVINNDKYPGCGKLCGTPYYIPPEIWNSKSDVNLMLADIYSFGVTLYCIFNKKTMPYDNKEGDMMALIDSITNDDPVTSDSGYLLLDQLIMTIIDKDPLKRPPITEIKISLEKIVEDNINI